MEEQVLFECEPLKYRSRIADAMKTVFWFSLLIFIGTVYFANILWAISLSGIVLLYNYIIATFQFKVYIYKILLHEKELEIQYFYLDEKKEIKGEVSRYNFYKGMVGWPINRTPSLHLIVSFDKDLKLNQYPCGKWTERDIIDVAEKVKHL